MLHIMHRVYGPALPAAILLIGIGAMGMGGAAAQGSPEARQACTPESFAGSATPAAKWHGAGAGHGPTKRMAKSTCRGGARRRCCRDLTPALHECRGALSAEYQKALRAAAHLRPGRQAKSSAWQAATLSASCTRGIPEWVAEVTIGFRVADAARYAARPFVMT
jgi:hypothetical protein